MFSSGNCSYTIVKHYYLVELNVGSQNVSEAESQSSYCVVRQRWPGDLISLQLRFYNCRSVVTLTKSTTENFMWLKEKDE